MNRDINSELIDNFLTGQISAREKAAFEEAMKKDPLLKNEVEVQRDIVGSIKNARKAQLKDRLNQIEVPSVSSSSSLNGVKIAASIILTAVTGATIFLFTTNNDRQETAVEAVPPSELIEPEITYSEQQEQFKEKAEPIEEEVEIAMAAPEETEEIATPKPLEPKKTETPAKEKAPEVSAEKSTALENLNFEPEMGNITEPSYSPDNSLELPSANPSQGTDLKVEGTDVKVSDSEKFKFHYKYYNNKLFLYGSFKEYYLREFKPYSKKHMYLFFDEDIYEIKETQDIIPLEKIKDKELIQQLKQLKEKDQLEQLKENER
ncbi:hypothetical protein RCC89_18020 [Cytophagaceae bacterium ABcell3]|nr:hypothetical protein RCC89_18020 [Cytophagaceae bacterium ABcell3]